MSKKCEKWKLFFSTKCGSNFMKYFIHIGLMFLSTNVFSVECKPDGNQTEINQCAFENFQQADDELNRTYQTLLRKMGSDKTYINNLRDAQRVWILFRDKELEAMFSCAEKDKKICWGSMYGLLYANAKAQLTRERTARLKKYIDEGQNASVQ